MMIKSLSRNSLTVNRPNWVVSLSDITEEDIRRLSTRVELAFLETIRRPSDPEEQKLLKAKKKSCQDVLRNNPFLK